MNISIVGAGVSGIFAAKTLVELGHHSTIIEKKSSIGGRMATHPIGNGHADSGAQFFTVRSKELSALTDEWLESGLVKKWFGDDFPRYTGINGMGPFIKSLSEDLEISLNEQVTFLSFDQERVNVISSIRESLYDAVILTAPVPQSLKLLKNSPGVLSPSSEKILYASAFRPCLVGLISLTETLEIGEKGIISENLPDGVDKIIANDQKGISSTPVLSIYMDADWSEAHYNQVEENILEEIISSLNKILSPRIISKKLLKRWRYAEAVNVYRQPFLRLDQKPIFLAGDSFLTKNDSSGRTRVESAILSGIYTGRAVHQELSINK
ncbi:NAD(P)/FAD-dependent oxidoreductase [Jeotgalibacillus proteolyticus]|uniref:Deoxyribodipyrimidine photolyase n=1 Tax=Jeotgalibacillus proteolyticus TaxID=2082395 RepID=A0A2S5G7V0_9BACL|nr:FAD-dependent oxidoreductase [Jeotgalibacillus proteolyticus]PPA69023.1 deoxyribodipyrimidine photolyase [Jeotgalibacillus proteolyticus]